MAVVTLRKCLPSYPWRRAFADALIKLRPDMNPDAADELSDSAFLTLCELPPAHAAHNYVENNGLDDDHARQRG